MGLWSAAGTAFVRLHYLGKELSTAVPNCKSSASALRKFAISTETPAAGKKSCLFFHQFGILFGRQANMPVTEIALLLDRTGQQQIVGRSFLRLFYPTLSSFMLSLLTPIFDFILRKQMFCFNLHAANYLGAPSWGPYALTMPQCHTRGLYLFFIFL